MILSMLDNDLYKFTQQQAILELYPSATATYKFINRRPEDHFSPSLASNLASEVMENLQHLRLTWQEAEWLPEHCPFLKPWYLEYLKNYRYTSEVRVRWEENKLDITVSGPWHRTVLWEVPLLAMVSELHFAEQSQRRGEFVSLGAVQRRAAEKAVKLSAEGVPFSDFGTRRRYSHAVQDLVVKALAETTEPHHNSSSFLGTSNVHFARKYGVRPVGTVAHEWVMAHSVLSGLRHANRAALDAWARVYRGDLGIALTDTYGLKPFWEDFDTFLSKLYDGVRQDSGDPFAFIDQAVAHYQLHGINPRHKTVVFSDGLNVETALGLHEACRGRIGCAFGIGTHFTHDIPDAPALNMVIKLDELNGEKVCKLSEVRTKASGDPEAVRIANDTFFLSKP